MAYFYLKRSYRMHIYLSLVLFVIKTISAQKCSTNICFSGFETKLQHFKNLLQTPPVISNLNFGFNFAEEKKLLEKANNISNDIKNTDIAEKISKFKTLNENSSNILKKLEEAVTEINGINKELETLHIKKEKHKEALGLCVKSAEEFNKLENDLKSIKRVGNTIKEKFASTLERVRNIKEESANLKKELDLILVPQSLYKKDLCSSKLKNAIKETIKEIENVSYYFDKSFKKLINSKIDDLETSVKKNTITVNKFEEEWAKVEVPKIDFKIKEENSQTIKNLAKEVKNIRKNYKNLLATLLKEYELILITTKYNLEKKLAERQEILEKLKMGQVLQDEVNELVANIHLMNNTCSLHQTVATEDETKPLPKL